MLCGLVPLPFVDVCHMLVVDRDAVRVAVWLAAGGSVLSA